MEILRSQDPLALFGNWLADARKAEPNDPEAMALATVNASGQPAVRMVLLKNMGPEGFTFFTNMESRKGQDLAENPRAALCFHWKTLNRQVRVEGRVETVGAAESDAYFRSRHPLSRLGAWASRQSQPLKSREELEARVAALEKQYAGQEIPRPPHWGGYRVVPSTIEFWQEGKGRLHDRFLFTKTADGWELTRLNP